MVKAKKVSPAHRIGCTGPTLFQKPAALWSTAVRRPPPRSPFLFTVIVFMPGFLLYENNALFSIPPRLTVRIHKTFQLFRSSYHHDSYICQYLPEFLRILTAPDSSGIPVIPYEFFVLYRNVQNKPVSLPVFPCQFCFCNLHDLIPFIHKRPKAKGFHIPFKILKMPQPFTDSYMICIVQKKTACVCELFTEDLIIPVRMLFRQSPAGHRPPFTA